MGSRGASSGGKWTGGSTGSLDVQSTTSLISERERKQREVDEVLTVFKDADDKYGLGPYDVLVATMSNDQVLAYYDSNDNLAVNSTYFNSDKMEKVYASGVKSGFHPSNGNKTALQAVVAHEMGHTLTAKAAGGFEKIKSFSSKVVSEAARSIGAKSPSEFAKKISGYAGLSPAEAIAEAYSDVYCNGSKAHSSSRAIVNTLNKYIKGS